MFNIFDTVNVDGDKSFVFDSMVDKFETGLTLYHGEFGQTMSDVLDTVFSDYWWLNSASYDDHEEYVHRFLSTAHSSDRFVLLDQMDEWDEKVKAPRYVSVVANILPDHMKPFSSIVPLICAFKADLGNDMFAPDEDTHFIVRIRMRDTYEYVMSKLRELAIESHKPVIDVLRKWSGVLPLPYASDGTSISHSFSRPFFDVYAVTSRIQRNHDTWLGPILQQKHHTYEYMLMPDDQMSIWEENDDVSLFTHFLSHIDRGESAIGLSE